MHFGNLMDFYNELHLWFRFTCSLDLGFFSPTAGLKRYCIESVLQVQVWCSVILLKSTSALRHVTCFILNVAHILRKICGVPLPFLTVDCQNCLE